MKVTEMKVTDNKTADLIEAGHKLLDKLEEQIKRIGGGSSSDDVDV